MVPTDENWRKSVEIAKVASTRVVYEPELIGVTGVS